jgi:hypothetical protein
MLLATIQNDLKTALKEKNELQVSTLRLLLAEIHNRQIEKQAELTEEDIVAVLRKEAKKRQESVEAYEKGGRQGLADKESKELLILSKYLPQEMSPQELEKIVKEVIVEVGAQGAGDFGKVMGGVMGKVKGQIDGAKVSEAVKKLL